MSTGIPIHSKVAKPQLFFWGRPILFVMNLLIMLVCFMTGRLVTGILWFVIGTLLSAFVAYTSVFFYEKRILPIWRKRPFKKEDYYV